MKGGGRGGPQTKHPRDTNAPQRRQQHQKQQQNKQGEGLKQKEGKEKETEKKELTHEEMLEKQNRMLEMHREQMKKNASALLLQEGHGFSLSPSSSDDEDDDEFGDQTVEVFKKFADTTFAKYHSLSGALPLPYYYVFLARIHSFILYSLRSRHSGRWRVS